MKRFFLVSIVILLVTECYSQHTYSSYYETLSKCEFISNLGQIEKKYNEAFRKNRPLCLSLLYMSSNYSYMHLNVKARRYLLKAAKAGVDRDAVASFSIMDSVLNADSKLEKSFKRAYHHFLTKKCDLINSLKIEQMFTLDQAVRSLYSIYTDKDTAFRKFKGKEMIRQDSINFVMLMKILNQPGFDPLRLTLNAQTGLGYILAHSSTNSYANPDIVFATLKNLVLQGAVQPSFYAFSYDRYYLYSHGENYYCHYYNPRMPIFDIENVDKRRAELWLYSLYKKFELNGNLSELPKEYHYDIDTIGK